VAIVCPACRADNAEGPACRRCKADLSALFALEADRAYAMGEARSALAAGEPARALPAALRARMLRRDEESGRLAAVCALCAGDFALAWRLYRETGQR
jgi:hypothetical protein